MQQGQLEQTFFAGSNEEQKGRLYRRYKRIYLNKEVWTEHVASPIAQMWPLDDSTYL